MDAIYQKSARALDNLGFNPRARDGRDPETTCLHCCSRSFNPRARDGRDTSMLFQDVNGASFNPRARDGRDYFATGSGLYLLVSIHAPVMDAML